MERTLELVFALATLILSIMLRGVLVVERLVPIPIREIGMGDDAQNMILIVIAIFLMLTAYRLFGGVIGFLAAVFFLLLITHLLAPDLLTGLEKT